MGRCVVGPASGLISFSADDSLYVDTGRLDSVLVSANIVGEDAEIVVCCTVDGALVVVVTLETTLCVVVRGISSSTKWSRLVGDTLTICLVGWGFGRGTFVVST